MNKNFLITKIKRVIYVGKNEYPETELNFSKNILSTNELIFHLSGKTTVLFNGKTLNTTSGSVRFLPKGEVKEYVVKKEIHGECIDIFFETDAPICDEAFSTNAKNDTKMGALFKKIFSVWVAKGDGYYFECISLLYKIFAELQKINYIPENQYSKIKPALKFIEENFLTQKISISSLSKKCGMSESYLKKLFVKEFGMPPAKYIIQLKINYACDLLQSGLYSITRISEMCGYSDLYYFSHQFKEYVGCSPKIFQSKYKSSK